MSDLNDIRFCVGDLIGVQFDKDHNKVVAKGLNGLDIVRPDAWLHKDAENDSETTKTAENVDYKETHPQICTVTASNPDYPFKVGDKLFVHYMAFETAQCGDLVTFDALIKANFVFFTILPNGNLKMAEDIYIGEPLITPEVITPGGIFLGGGKKETLRIKLTHVPEPFYKYIPRIKARSEYLSPPCAKAGDIVVSIDRYNYDFKYEGKVYTKLTSSEIAGVYEGDLCHRVE